MRDFDQKNSLIVGDLMADGQGFRGVEIDKNVMPFGATFLEFPKLESAPSDPNILNYNFGDLNIVSDFSFFNYKFLSNFGPIEQISLYKTYFNGKLFGDFVLGNCLDIVKDLDAKKIKNEISLMKLDKSNHPSKKSTFDPLRKLNYNLYSNLVHTSEIHNKVIAPLARKIIGDQQIEVLKYHRANWLPIYWPETILNTINSCGDLKEYVFYKWRDLNFAEWTRSLCKKSADVERVNSTIQKIVKSDGSFIIFFSNGRKVVAKNIFSCWNITQLNNILGFSDTNYESGHSIFLAYIYFPKADSCISASDSTFVVDDENCIYRLTRYGNYICLELSYFHLCHLSSDDRIDKIKTDFATIMKCSSAEFQLCYLKEFANARANLSVKNFVIHKKLEDANKQLGLFITGAAAGFGLGSISDQLIQGKKFSLVRAE